MYITPYSIYNNGTRDASSISKRNIRTDINNPAEETTPRMFSDKALSTVMARPDLLGETAMKTISYRVLKDVRTGQNEAAIYVSQAAELMRTFNDNYKANPEYYSTNSYGREGNITKEIVETDDGRFVCYYRTNGDIYRVNKIKDGKLQRAYFPDPHRKNGTVNYADYRDDGSVREIAIGYKRYPNGMISKDKVFEFDNANRLIHGAFDFKKNPDGTKTMKNYFRPNSLNDEYIDKYAGTRTVDKDGKVTYKDVIYFDYKSFWRYFPQKQFEQGKEHIRLTEANIDD